MPAAWTSTLQHLVANRSAEGVENGRDQHRRHIQSRMAAELKVRGAFPGCRRKTNEIGLRKLYTSIKHEGLNRCCVVQYDASVLGDTIKKMRDTLDDGFLVLASVLSGLCTGQGGRCSDKTCCDDPGPRLPFPDHWVLIIGHDGGNKFVYWDPDGEVRNSRASSNATRHCNGFGFFFFDPVNIRLSTEANNSEVTVDTRGDHASLARSSDSRIGVSCCTTAVSNPQHRYQVLQIVTV
jgi:hypothetical protein